MEPAHLSRLFVFSIALGLVACKSEAQKNCEYAANLSGQSTEQCKPGTPATGETLSGAYEITDGSDPAEAEITTITFHSNKTSSIIGNTEDAMGSGPYEVKDDKVQLSFIGKRKGEVKTYPISSDRICIRIDEFELCKQ